MLHFFWSLSCAVLFSLVIIILSLCVSVAVNHVYILRAERESQQQWRVEREARLRHIQIRYTIQSVTGPAPSEGSESMLKSDTTLMSYTSRTTESSIVSFIQYVTDRDETKMLTYVARKHEVRR